MEKQKKTRQLMRAALLCAQLCVLALVVVPIGPVPFSMAVLGVALIGALQPPLWAAASLGCYLLLGLFGLPVFAGFAAGPVVLMGPTGGFLVGYFALALSLSFGVRAKLPPPLLGACGVAGLAGCYLLGTAWFMVVTGVSFLGGLGLCVVPFVLPDLAKVALALLLAHAVQKRLSLGAV